MRDACLASSKIRGEPVRTTVRRRTASSSPGNVKLQLHALAPSALWIGDFSYVRTWMSLTCVVR
jgi:hypothetical protein